MANDNIILIPSTHEDLPIGNVFNNFFVISSATEVLENHVVWDFSNVYSIHPFLVAALALYRNACGKSIRVINLNEEIESYLDDIKFQNIPFIEDSSHLSLDIGHYQQRRYIPITSFNASDDATQQVLQDIILCQSHAESISVPLAYILGELTCNIGQHSGSTKAYLFSQYIENQNAIYMCLADCGIGIYSSYVKASKYIEEIGDNDAEALRIANEGLSTKNLPEAENRGFGISTSKNMLVNGMGGHFYMISGSALQMSSPGTSDSFIELPSNVEWQGTMIFLKIPISVKEGFVYTNYLE